MIGYVKNRKTFVTTHLLEMSEYTLVLGSINNNVSKVTVIGELSGLEDDFFIYEGNIWIIKTLAPDNGKTVITLNDISYLFSRDLYWSGTAETTIEGLISDTIDTGWTNLSDTMYQTPWLTVTTTTTTSLIQPDIENDLWNLKAYIAKVRRMKNVFLFYSVSGDYLNITVSQITPPLRKIDFAGSDSQLISELYQKTSVAKITVNGTTDYYLFTDGTFSTNPSAGTRVDGSWTMLQVRVGDDEQEEVANTFSKNSDSHIVEFWTEQPCELYDSVQIRSNGRVTNGFLSYVSISSEDNRRRCRTGDLINTVQDAITMLSDKIDTVIKAEGIKL